MIGHVRMTVWIKEEEHARFQALFPNQGAFTRIVRLLLSRHMDMAEKRGAALLQDNQPEE